MTDQIPVVNLPRLIEIINSAGGLNYERHISYNDVNVTNGRATATWLASLATEIRFALTLAEAAREAADQRQYSREDHIAKAAGVNPRTGLLEPKAPTLLDLNVDYPKVVGTCGACGCGIWRNEPDDGEGWRHSLANPSGCEYPAPL